ncbi:MaoC family dehydratase [Micromonospora sp. NPDC047557]|uniref:MaoC family dehydratase n=1 Tax=Micromonospora sp. NPDC047557 TaxID=3364250 RepID=UPI00371D614C
MTRRFAGPADLPAAAGTELGVSRWRPVTQSLIDGFAALNGDRQWIHVDPQRAAAGPFGAPIAHGYLLLALVTPMLDEIFTVGGGAAALNKGVDRLRFRGPVTAGARIRARAVLSSAVTVPGGYVDVTVAVTVEREGERVPAYTMDSLMLFRRDVVASR